MDVHDYPVLFVDDEEANRVVFRANFGPHFRVLLASSGAEALELLRETRAAVLIADQRMPGMSGVELAEAVRVRHPDVIRTIVTAYADVQAAINAINRGQVSRYISKPWNVLDVRSYLQDAIERVHLARRLEELQAQMLRCERLATLGLVASSLSHDLSGPVGALIAIVDDLTRQMQELRQEGRRSSLAGRLADVEATAADARVAAARILHVLEAARACIHSRSRRERVLLDTVVGVAAQLARTEVSHKATMHVACGPELWVLGDPAELTQVVINLLVNAANAIQEGHQMENSISVTVSGDERAAVIHVADTGCGIPPELREKIFEPLFTTRQSEGGTGLGLAIVRRIVEAHQGTIVVESAVGKGTTFTVRLPLASTPSHQVA